MNPAIKIIGYVAIQNPRQTAYFAKPEEFLYLTPKFRQKYASWYMPKHYRVRVWSRDLQDAKVYRTHELCARHAARTCNGTFLIQPVARNRAGVLFLTREVA